MAIKIPDAVWVMGGLFLAPFYATIGPANLLL